jgi:hypothetical protein
MNYPRLPAIITPRAKVKLLDQRDWYNRQQNGLGDRFYHEILDAVAFLEENYHMPPSDRGSKGVKRYVNCGDFPWLIYYKILSDRLTVASFAHPKQKPTRNRD